MSDDPRALVPRGAPPPLVMARSLEAASPRSLVHIDGKGQVRSPVRYRAQIALAYGLSAYTVGALTLAATTLWGLPGIGVGAGAGWLVARGILRARKIRHAVQLLVHDRLDEAEALLRDVQRSWGAPRLTRAIVEQNLGACAVRRGRFDDALAHHRAALALYRRRNRRRPQARMVEYQEIVTLVNLDRAAEARRIFGERHGKVPDGNYLRVQHWVAELYLALAEGEHRLDEDALHERARAALGITGAVALLGLVAWAHDRSGDSDQAWHLLREAHDRPDGAVLERTLPRLHAWMEAHRADAAAAADAIDL